MTVDGKAHEPQDEMDLGTILTPKRLVVEVWDADNPIDESSVAVWLDGSRIDRGSELVHVEPADAERKSVTVEFALKRALSGGFKDAGVCHTVSFRAHDLSIDRHAIRACQ